MSEKMIEYCNQKYKERTDVTFVVLDIMKETDFVHKYGQMDHIISSYVIHWLPDPAEGLRHIFNLLKPGGDLFSVHVRSSAIFDILAHMDQDPKWGQYFDNLTQFVPHSHHSAQAEQDLNGLLSKSGFTDIFIETIWEDCVLESYDTFLSLFSGTLPQVQRVPELIRPEYVKEFLDYGISQGLIKQLSSGEIRFPLNLFITYARKPL